MKIKKAKMMITGNGINTVTVNGKVKHITELDYITLCLEWTKLREENNRLYGVLRRNRRNFRPVIFSGPSVLGGGSY